MTDTSTTATIREENADTATTREEKPSPRQVKALSEASYFIVELIRARLGVEKFFGEERFALWNKKAYKEIESALDPYFPSFVQLDVRRKLVVKLFEFVLGQDKFPSDPEWMLDRGLRFVCKQFLEKAAKRYAKTVQAGGVKKAQELGLLDECEV